MKSSVSRGNPVANKPQSKPDRWDATHGTYLTGRAYLDGADALAAEMERSWGADRLRLMVSTELREKFDRQRYLLRQAVEGGTLDDIRRESTRMTTALNTLNGAALAAKKDPLDAEVMEVALPDGAVLAIVGEPSDTHRALARREGRKMTVYTLDEIALLVATLPAAVDTAKQTWPGATVTKVARRIKDPLNVIARPTGFDDALDDLWTTEQHV
jgi:hypothetical protein